MKRSSKFVFALLLVTLMAVTVSAGVPDRYTKPLSKKTEEVDKPARTTKKPAELSSSDSPVDAADPNSRKKTDPTDKAFNELDTKRASLSREWLREADNKRLTLAKAVHGQVNLELTLLRKIAAEEGATKTSEAIDRLIAQRASRFEKLSKKLSDEKRRQRLSKRAEKKEKKERSRDRDKGDSKRKSRGKKTSKSRDERTQRSRQSRDEPRTPDMPRR